MRPEKANIVSDLSAKLKGSPFVLVTDYQRMKVDQFSELRNRLAPAGAEIHVVKNSFLKRAMTDSGLPDVADQSDGSNCDCDGRKRCRAGGEDSEDVCGGIQNRALKIGIVDRAILPSKDVEAMADLPSREVLLAQLLGLLLSPATKLVALLNEPPHHWRAFAQCKSGEREGKASGRQQHKKFRSLEEAGDQPTTTNRSGGSRT